MTASVGRAEPAGPSGLRARARWTLAFRLARREARRHPWRHGLVVLLIFVPVLATFTAFSGMATTTAIDRRQSDGSSAGADAVITLRQLGFPSGAGPIEPLGAAGPGVHVERTWKGVDWLVPSDTDSTDLIATETAAVPTDGRLTARFRVDRGRLPRRADEVFLTTAAATAGGWDVGDQVALATADRPFTVVGTGVARDDVRDRLVVLSDAVPESYWTRSIGGDIDAVSVNQTYLDPNEQTQSAAVWVPTGVDPSSVEPTRSAAWHAISEPTIATDPVVSVGVTMAGAGLAMLTAVVASAAFAIGARRQLRNVGLLATAGADPAVVRTALVLQGALPGAVASALALATGAAVAQVLDARSVAERVSGVADATVVLSAGGAAVAALIGVAAGVAAAWQPARSTSRLPLLSALAGRRPVRPVPTRVPLAGLAALAVGFGLLAVSSDLVAGGSDLAGLVPIAGVICFALGAVGLAPAAVAALGPVAGRATGIGRLALRGLVRHRGQSAATVAAVAVSLALPIGLLTAHPRDGAAGDRYQDPMGRVERVLALRPGALTITISGADSTFATNPAEAARIQGAYRGREAKVRAALDAPAARISTRLVPVPRGTPLGTAVGDTARVAVIDDDDLEQALAPWAAAELERGRVLVLRYGVPARFRLGPASATDLQAATVPDGGLAAMSNLEADLVVSASVAGRLGDAPVLDGTSFVRPTPATASERQRLAAIDRRSLEDAPTLPEVRSSIGAAPTNGGTSAPERSVFVYVDDGSTPPLDPWALATLALAAAATLLALVVLTITLSLRSVDGADDVRAALAAGAPPAAMRRLRATEGAVLTALGATLALPLGWLPVAAVAWDPADGTRLTSIGGPGWLAVPVLVVPVLLATAVWTVVPAVRAVVTARRSVDLVLPRW